ncbi:MAG: hypothetical protein HYZ28_24405 [Myxococcales bacterium]|nr:hypothetical protein [Myxococcales bacterium]
MARDKDDDGSGFTGKRNKSWREIDAQRGKTKYHSRHDDREQQRIERSATYSRYKAAADSLFTGGDLPEGLAKAFDPEGKRKAQKEAMLKLRELPDRKAWVQGVIEYLEKYPELPDDPYFLDSLLDHPRDRIVDKSLGALEQLHESGRLKAKLPKSLEQRLKSLELTSVDPEVQQRAKELREKIRAYA